MLFTLERGQNHHYNTCYPSCHFINLVGSGRAVSVKFSNHILHDDAKQYILISDTLGWENKYMIVSEGK